MPAEGARRSHGGGDEPVVHSRAQLGPVGGRVMSRQLRSRVQAEKFVQGVAVPGRRLHQTGVDELAEKVLGVPR
jgi:hypothetical protein